MATPSISDLAGVTSVEQLRFTQSGKAVLNFRLAFNDSKYDEQQSKWVTTRTFYVDATVWEQTAERLGEWLAQGDQIYVTGSLETQQWEQDGQKRSKPLLNVQTVRKLAPSYKPQQQQSQGSYQGQPQPQGNWGGQQQPAPADNWGQPSNDPPF